MGKNDQLKGSMKGGLDSLLSSTSSSSKKKTKNKKVVVSVVPSPSSNESPVHCNFVMSKSVHTRMKLLAIERNMSLRDVVNEAMEAYLGKYKR